MHRLRGLSAITVLVFVSMWPLTKTSYAETRVALVIGNGAYQNAPRLPNPSNDAADVAASLKRSGFETILATDLDKTAMDAATIRFARVARTADVALFYYSGHALQFGGVNYLAPVDAKLTDEADLRRMVRVDEIVSDLQQAKNLRILVLDSCRDNPLADELKRSIGTTRALPLQRGLARIDSPQGMIVAYATQSGRTADDGLGRNSPYTTAFLKNIEANDEIGTIFRRISADVYEATKHTQLPELSLSLIGEFYLKSSKTSVVKTDLSVGDPEASKSDGTAIPNHAPPIEDQQDHKKETQPAVTTPHELPIPSANQKQERRTQEPHPKGNPAPIRTASDCLRYNQDKLACYPQCSQSQIQAQQRKIVACVNSLRR
jgi:Caspase domain